MTNPRTATLFDVWLCQLPIAGDGISLTRSSNVELRANSIVLTCDLSVAAALKRAVTSGRPGGRTVQLLLRVRHSDEATQLVSATIKSAKRIGSTDTVRLALRFSDLELAEAQFIAKLATLQAALDANAKLKQRQPKAQTVTAVMPKAKPRPLLSDTQLLAISAKLENLGLSWNAPN